MEQSNVIFAAFFLVFLIYITLKGELPTYLGFLKPNTSGSNPALGNNSPGAAPTTVLGSPITPGNANVTVPGIGTIFSFPGWTTGANPAQIAAGRE